MNAGTIIISGNMLKKLFIIFLFVFALAYPFGTIHAKNEQKDQDIPEENGVYGVPGHPNLKVKVFVHYPKSKPTPPVPVCDLNDPDSQAQPSAAGWYLPASWTYSLNTSSVPSSVGSVNLPVFALTAFTNWSNAIGNKVNFARGQDTVINRKGLDGINIIAWGKLSSGNALAITYTWYNPATGIVAETDTIMNDRVSWGWYSGTGTCNGGVYDAQDILTHELGHWVGLDDHYTAEYVNNTMYGYGSKGEIRKDTLATGDILGTSVIYK